MSLYGLIPEAVNTYTSSTSLEKHASNYVNEFGRYSYRDIPVKAFPYGVNHLTKDGYSYNIASVEKALCDFLAISKPLKNKKELNSYLFNSLRIDKSIFINLNYQEMIDLAKLYKRKNTKLFVSLLEDYQNGKYH